ncbi:ABC transporter substrate-binding protein [Kineococcus gynurae]|uniref:ABC transporter substrate-binding protein n=1 Tax=Kineococcus gynurae TaxID=452979 RepID=A0ABV5LSK0_9ACTN
MPSSLPRRRSVLAGLAGTAGLASLAACGDSATETGATPTATATAEAGAFPVTITHALGKAEIPAQPKRVVTWGWGSGDVCWKLGTAPVAVPTNTYGAEEDGTLAWWEGYYDASVTTLLPNPDGGQVPFEAIAAATPDLILAVYSGITQDDFDRLTQIAPTVAYPDGAWKTPWQTQTTLIGEALGQKAAAEKLVTDTEASYKEKAAADPAIAGKTFAYLYATEASLSVYLPGDSRVDLLSDMGLVNAPIVEELAGTTDQFYTELAKERSGDMDAQVIVGYGTLTLEQLQADPVYGAVPAVKAGSVAWLTDEAEISATSPTVLSLPWVLDRFLPSLAEAAGKAPA